MNPVGAFLTLACSLVIFAGPRRIAILALMMSVCYISQGQMVEIAGFHFTSVRAVLLVGFVRMIVRGELTQIRLNKIDYAMIGYAVVSTVFPTIREGTHEEMVNELGFAYNTLLSYFVFRGLLTTAEELQDFFTSVAVLVLPLALCMIHESMTGNNVFNFMGGRESNEDGVREGRYRCVGIFRGPHTSGTFGATLIPPFIALYFLNPRRRLVAVAGIIAGTVMTYTANASGPLMAFLSCVVGLIFWPMRFNMKRVRWGIVIAIASLSMAMKAPVWYVFAKISSITGGDGWSRSYLMEQCFNDFSRWWKLGTSETGNWAPVQTAWGGADLCNVYVSAAAQGGLAALVLLILLFVWCFQQLGLALKVTRQNGSASEILVWCLGCTFFAHVVTLFSVTYFDQLHVVWWGGLACISSITGDILAAQVQEPILEVTETSADEPVHGERAFPPI